jgi:integrase
LGKRGNGEGSIYRRKDGRWAGQCTVQTITGPKRKTFYGKTRAEVATKLAKAIAESENGIAFDAGKMTVGAYLDSWLTDSVRGNVRPSTFVRSETLVRLHVKPVLGRIKLATLGPAHVQALYRAKLDQGLSPTTVHRIHEVFHTALKLAVRWRLIPRNPCEAVTVPRRSKPEIRPLTPDQARAFLKAAEGEHYEAFFVLALTAGTRLGELRGLRWDAVDFERGRVQVRRTLVRAGNVLVFGEPKTAKGRAVALTPRAVISLNRHKELQRAAGKYEEAGLVFKTPRAGWLIDPEAVQRAATARFKRARHVPDTSF